MWAYGAKVTDVVDNVFKECGNLCDVYCNSYDLHLLNLSLLVFKSIEFKSIK